MGRTTVALGTECAAVGNLPGQIVMKDFQRLAVLLSMFRATAAETYAAKMHNTLPRLAHNVAVSVSVLSVCNGMWT